MRRNRGSTNVGRMRHREVIREREDTGSPRGRKTQEAHVEGKHRRPMLGEYKRRSKHEVKS